MAPLLDDALAELRQLAGPAAPGAPGLPRDALAWQVGELADPGFRASGFWV